LGQMTSAEITSVTVTPRMQTPSRVVFDVTYTGNLPNVTAITERYVITPDGVKLTTQVSGYSGALRYLWPVLSNNGTTASTIGVSDKTVSVSQGGSNPQTFTAPNAQSVRVETSAYSNHNGWARLGVAEYPSGGEITLLIAQTTAPSTSPEQTWLEENFGANSGNPTIAGNTADPDGDGISNLLERAFGGNPNAVETSVIPRTDDSVSAFSIVYQKAKAATDLIITVQETSDLSGQWSMAVGTSEALSDDGTVQRIRFTPQADSSTRKFLRVKVTSP
jgi:hypothetical protein